MNEFKFNFKEPLCNKNEVYISSKKKMHMWQFRSDVLVVRSLKKGIFLGNSDMRLEKVTSQKKKKTCHTVKWWKNCYEEETSEN